MNLHWMMKKFYAEEDGSGTSGGQGATPAETVSEGADGDSADWGTLNADAAPGMDDGGDTDEDAGAAETAESLVEPTTGEVSVDQNLEDAAKVEPLTPVDSDEPVEALTPEQQAAKEQEFVAKYAKWEQGEVSRLASEDYAIDEETATRLQTEPELVLPQIAAQLHIKVMRNTLEAVQRMLPQMMPQVLQSSNVEKAATDKFYEANPDLVKHHKQVLQAGAMFRKMNPKATPEDAIKRIGDMVRAASGLPPVGTKASAPAPKGKMAPHKPAAAGATGKAAPAAKPEGTGFWAEMAGDDDD